MGRIKPPISSRNSTNTNHLRLDDVLTQDSYASAPFTTRSANFQPQMVPTSRSKTEQQPAPTLTPLTGFVANVGSITQAQA